jgi:hypothetical protein
MYRTLLCTVQGAVKRHSESAYVCSMKDETRGLILSACTTRAYTARYTAARYSGPGGFRVTHVASRGPGAGRESRIRTRAEPKAPKAKPPRQCDAQNAKPA